MPSSDMQMEMKMENKKETEKYNNAEIKNLNAIWTWLVLELNMQIQLSPSLSS